VPNGVQKTAPPEEPEEWPEPKINYGDEPQKCGFSRLPPAPPLLHVGQEYRGAVLPNSFIKRLRLLRRSQKMEEPEPEPFSKREEPCQTGSDSFKRWPPYLVKI